MNSKQIIDRELDVKKFWSRFFELKESNSQQHVCPIHDDHDPSLTLNLEEGRWFCHACNRGGDKYELWMAVYDCDFATAVRQIADEYDIVIGKVEKHHGKNKATILTNINRYSSELRGNQAILAKLKERGISGDTVLKMELGWDPREKRLWIPIKENEQVVAIRKWDLLKVHKKNQKFTSFKGWNPVTLWPTNVIKQSQTVWLLGGEPDTLTALSMGFPAVTFTNGEGKTSQVYLPYFKGKNVYICFDIDEAGKRATEKVADKLKDIAKTVYLVDLPPDGLPPNGDFTDFAKLLDFNREKIDKARSNARLYEAAEKPEPEPEPSLENGEDKYFSIEVSEANLSKHFNKKVEVSGILAGRVANSFFAPKQIVASCDMNYGDVCNECPMFSCGGVKRRNISENGDMLRIIEIDDKMKRREMKSMLRGVPVKCPRIEFHEEDISNVDFIQLIPEVDLDAEENFKFKTVGAYTVGLSELEDNEVYALKGRIIADPRNQKSIVLATKAEITEKSYNRYNPTKDILDNLRDITAGPDATLAKIEDCINVRTKDLMVNVCGLVGRADLIKVYDIVWHSVRSFNFQNRRVNKGLCEALVLGDTRTGKSAAAENLIRFFKSGKYINCEGATLAGIIGGQNAYGSRLVFTWGVIPMQDGRLVVLDESQDLSVDIIGSLSAIRSRGVATRPIVGGERSAKAQVRLVWIANPRSNRTIKEFTSGVDAIRELIGKEEDIARFDMALLIAKDEVDEERFFKDFPEVDKVWGPEVASTLVSWAWSRTANQIQISRETEQNILKYARELSIRFGKSIPTVQPAEMRIRLAKIAVALAVLSFSTEDGITVKVKSEHAEYAMLILQQLYTKKSFGADVVDARHETRTIQEVNKKRVMDLIAQYGIESVNYLLRNGRFRKEDFYYIVHGYELDPRLAADDLIKDLSMTYNCLYRKSGYWVKDKQFTEWLLELKEKITKESDHSLALEKKRAVEVARNPKTKPGDVEQADQDMIDELFNK